MYSLNRREFLYTSAIGITGFSTGLPLWADASPKEATIALVKTADRKQGVTEALDLLEFPAMKGKKVFEQLRDTIRGLCKKTVNVEVLVDDDECVRKVKTFSKMTGCTVSFEPRGDQFLIRITGEACKCV